MVVLILQARFSVCYRHTPAAFQNVCGLPPCASPLLRGALPFGRETSNRAQFFWELGAHNHA